MSAGLSVVTENHHIAEPVESQFVPNPSPNLEC